MPEAPVPTQQQQDLAAMIQQVGTEMLSGGSTPPTPATPPAPQQAAPAAPPEGPKPAATTVPDNGLIMGKFKNMDEATKAHHLLIHGQNSLKAENDRLAAENAALKERAPLTPGRVDPSAPAPRSASAAGPDDELWKNRYGIDPTDVDARIDARLAASREAENRPVVAMQAADAYMADNHPDFLNKVNETKAFVQANPQLRARVGELWGEGQYAAAMEIGWLAYDNALRATQVAAEMNDRASAQVGASRGDASSIPSQAGGAREVIPAPGSLPSGNRFPTTSEDWVEIRRMKAAGRDDEVRQILYGHTIAHIPALNPAR